MPRCEHRYNPTRSCTPWCRANGRLRSDRAQNARSEALNLVRNRKGRLPHVVVVTGEPTPVRISSLALGTGDIDCVYHFALHELFAAVRDKGDEDTKGVLDMMIDGKRPNNIADLPLDLPCNPHHILVCAVPIKMELEFGLPTIPTVQYSAHIQ